MNANAGTMLIRISAELISAGDRNTKFLKEKVTGDKPGVSYKILSVTTVVHTEIAKSLTATNFQQYPLKGKILKIFSYKQGTEHQM